MLLKVYDFIFGKRKGVGLNKIKKIMVKPS